MASRVLTRARNVANEDGQTIVLGMVLLVGLFTIFAVALDVGAAWTQRRNMQNVADSAALAGAQELDGSTAGRDAAEAVALDYVAKNVSNLAAAPTITFNEGVWTEIKVVVAKESPSFFLANFGIGNHALAAKATARIASPLLPGPGVVPLAIDLPTYEACIDDGDCEGVTLKEFSGNNDNPRRNFGFLDLGGQGGGTTEICNYLRGGSTIAITDPDRAEPGNKNGMRECLHDRMTAAADDSDGIRCLTIEDVLDATGALKYECNPLGGAGRGADPDYPDAQPTAVIIIPVVQDFDEGGCNSPNNCVDIIGSGDELRTFAFFLIDLTTVEAVDGIGPSCRGSGGGPPQPQYPGGPPPGQCWITGQFLNTWLAPVSTRYDLPTGEYDPSLALLKIVQLID